MLLSAVLLGCGGLDLRASTAAVDPPTKEKVCREWINAYVGDPPRRCSNNLRPVSSNYVVKGKYVYWIDQKNHDERPCPMGMLTFLARSSSLGCIASSRNEPREVEERKLYGGMRYLSSFHSLEGSIPLAVNWQKRALANYAKDEESVYFKGKKIEGAVPQQFSVIFPFGEDWKWNEFNVLLSGRALFLNGKKTEYVDLHQFHAFTAARCPGHGLSSCAGVWYDWEFIKYDRVLGWVGNDIVLLRREGVTRFPDMTSPDMFMFATSKRFYIYSNKKFYELDWDGKNISDMDVDFYENRF